MSGITDRLGGLSGSGLFGAAPEAPAEAPKLSFSRGSAAAEAPAPAKTIKRNQYPGRCTECNGWIEEQAGLLTKTAEGKWGVKHDSLSACTAAAWPARPAPTSTLDLGALPTPIDEGYAKVGRYGVPGSESRLKVSIEKPVDGKWEGWIFVRDAAEYGNHTRYGSQAPGKFYRGQIEDELRAILADPQAAAARYGQLTSTCGMCGRTLETEESVARGIGPVCSKRYFG